MPVVAMKFILLYMSTNFYQELQVSLECSSSSNNVHLASYFFTVWQLALPDTVFRHVNLVVNAMWVYTAP